MTSPIEDDMSDSGAPFNAPHVSLVRDQTTDFLRQAILDLRFKPGQRLVDRQLVAWTGVSRATIRETIRQLAAEGLVEIVPLKGAIVARPTIEEMAAIDEVRAVLEGFAARQFTVFATDEQVAELSRSVDEIERLVLEGANRWLTFKEKVHYYEILFEGAGNGVLQGVLNGLLHRVVPARVGYSRRSWPMSVVHELREVIDAIVARDPEAAEKAAVRHVELRGKEGAEFLANVALGPGEDDLEAEEGDEAN